MKFVTLISFLIIVFSVMVNAQSSSVYVLNTIGEDVSQVDLGTGTVTSSAFGAGLFTNQIRIKGERAYVINSGDNEIQVVNLLNGNTINNIDFGSGTNPWGMAFVNDSIAAVSLLFTNQVVFVNLHTGNILGNANVGTGPEGLLYNDGKVYVANSGFNGAGYDPGLVSVIDATSFNVITSIPVGINPQSLALDVNGNIIAACTGDYYLVGSQMDIIDGNTLTVIDSVESSAFITAVNVSADNKAYLGTFGSGILVYDLTNQTFERDSSNPLPGGPEVTFDGNGNAYVVDFGTDSLYVFSPDHALLDEFLVGDGPISLALFEAGPSAIDGDEINISQSIRLLPNYPNPFNPATKVRFELNHLAEVQIDIVSVNGTIIRTLLNNRLPAGYHELAWDGRTDSGIAAASGLYFLHLRSKNEFFSQKMHLIR